jgi:hypothetical protein
MLAFGGNLFPPEIQQGVDAENRSEIVVGGLNRHGHYPFNHHGLLAALGIMRCGA